MYGEKYNIILINRKMEFYRNFGLKLQPFNYKEKVAVWFTVHTHGSVHKFLKGCSFDVTTICELSKIGGGATCSIKKANATFYAPTTVHLWQTRNFNFVL